MKIDFKHSFLALALMGLYSVMAADIRVAVPAQKFVPGGWGLDCQFMDVMGSPYLIAHGLGECVLDATAQVQLPESGSYRVWVRTRNWAKGNPGQFRVAVDGTFLKPVFGIGRDVWSWEDGGRVTIATTTPTLALHDLTGFDGRCAGILLTRSDTPPDGPLPYGGDGVERVTADFVVVGGGLPGTCAAMAAARRGLKVALVQDRPVLGGNASSEIRVWSAGEMRHPLVRELRGFFMNRDVNTHLGDNHRMRLVQDEKNIRLLLSTRAYGATTNAAGHIACVQALDLARNVRVQIEAPLFCDATGDGWLGYWAGADWRMGREAQQEYDESMAPEKADGDTLGSSLMWTSAEANAPRPFSAPWAEEAAQGEEAVNGEWNWEYGIHRDIIAEGEQIRDRLLLAIYGAFSRAKKRAKNSHRVLNFCPYLLGKRESRRLLGDWIYSQRDVTELRTFEDAIGTGSWSLDLHFDDCKEGVDFLTTCRQPHYGRYWIPYRAIYSRNVTNLFVVGRCFSCTHVGLSGPRVICTLAQLGVAAGEAAAMCRELKCTPREVYTRGHARALQRRIGGDWPGNPDPKQVNWRIIDDESPAVKFGSGWHYRWCACGGQVGNRAHFRSGKNLTPERLAQLGDVTYPLPVTKPGRYNLYGRVPYCWNAQAGSKIAYALTSGSTVEKGAFDPTAAADQWLLLGTYTLQPGAELRVLARESCGTVIADGFAVEMLE